MVTDGSASPNGNEGKNSTMARIISGPAGVIQAILQRHRDGGNVVNAEVEDDKDVKAMNT